MTRDCLPNSPGSSDVGTRIASMIEETTVRITEVSGWLRPLRMQLQQIIVGQDHLIDRLLVSLLTGGHLLIEGPSGLGKTLIIKTLARAVAVDFRRIQFTPDLLPADIIGTEIYYHRDTGCTVQRGPLFTSLLLAVGINRAPAKVQSALLEAMQETQVTIGTASYPLPELFLVLATQNPFEMEGTYPLPQALIDRFMLTVTVSFPTPEDERRIIDLYDRADEQADVQAITSAADILAARRVVPAIHLDHKVKDYIVSLVCASREPSRYGLDLAASIESGASPRATLHLKNVARSIAFLDGRGYVTPDDVKEAAVDVLRHRIRPSYEAEAESITSDDIVRTILDTIPVP